MRFKIATKIGIVFLAFFVEILLFMGIFSIFAQQHKYNICELREEIAIFTVKLPVPKEGGR